MVFKILQKSPLGTKSLLFQVAYASFLFIIVSLFGFSWLAFFIGLIFSQIYMLLFYYAVFMFFKQKKQTIGFIFIFIKWLFLLLTLILVSYFLEAKAFLIGFSSMLSFLVCFVFENAKKSYR